MTTFSFILVLVVAVIASQPIARIVRVVPLPILQIAIGAALAWPITGGVHVGIEPELFLLIFIPPLLYADAWQAPKREYRKLLRPILSLAFGLVFFTIVIFGYALHWIVPELPLPVAFALAAVLSPTDAVAVSSIVDKTIVPKSLMHILEGESLLNDASGLVMFRFATAAALTGSFSLSQASVSFVLAVLGGVGAGFLALFIVGRALKLLARLEGIAPEAQVMVMLLLPFTAYLIAEQWHASGILAAVIAGLNLGRMRAFEHLGVSARMLTTAMWTMLSFVFNGTIFVLLGLQLPSIIRDVPSELTTVNWLWQPIVVVAALTLCLIVLRYLWISIAIFMGGLVNKLILKRLPPEVSARTRLAGSVAGVRGAVTLAGVLSLPLLMPDGSAFPARDLAIFLAAGVILCWLAVAALFLPPIVRGLARSGGHAEAAEEQRARIAAAQAAIEKLEGMVAGGEPDAEVVPERSAAERLIASYRHRISALEEGESLQGEIQAVRLAEARLRGLAVDAEREAVRDMLRRGEINDVTLRKLVQETVLAEALMATKTQR